MHSEGIWYKPRDGEVRMCPRVGRMGRISEDGPGHHNPDRSEGPWGRAAESARTEVFTGASARTQSRGNGWSAESTEDAGKPADWEGRVWNSGLEAVPGKTRRTEF